MTKKRAAHALDSKGSKFGVGVIAGAAGVAAMFSVVAPANAATAKVNKLRIK